MGGNLLHLLFHDIAHHFISPNQEAEEWLAKAFEAEDEFLRSHQSDHVFGIYKLTDQ